jgi:methylmalonyl-CoA/ethylmalonyl-CoA epimerase
MWLFCLSQTARWSCYNPPHEDGPVAKFIEAKGEGIQHIAYRVENIEDTLAELKAKNVRLIDEKPRKGAGGAKIAFIHPKETNGVLVEICERD